MAHPLLKLSGAALLCLLGPAGQAQVSHRLSLRLPASKDGLNNGLLFRGAGLTYGVAVQTRTPAHLRVYEAQIGAQVLQRRGLLGAGLLLGPFAYTHGFRLGRHPNRTVYLGPRVSLAYQLPVYPDLQMGHVLWLTSAALSPQLTVEQRVGRHLLIARAATSVLAVTSRPGRVQDHYFSLRFADLFRDVHSRLQFSPVGTFTQTDVGVEYRLAGRRRDWSLGYDLQHIHYAGSPAFQALTHGLALKFYRQ